MDIEVKLISDIGDLSEMAQLRLSQDHFSCNLFLVVCLKILNISNNSDKFIIILIVL